MTSGGDVHSDSAPAAAPARAGAGVFAGRLAGVAVVIFGMIASPAYILEFLLGQSTGFPDKLMLGATIFKFGCIVSGVVVLGISGLYSRGSATRDQRDRRGTGVGGGLCLAAILLMALALRLYNLNAGLWFDEILTYVNYAVKPLGAIVTTYDNENQHFLYSILANISFRWFGEGAASLRLPAALFGVASVYALYVFARDVTTTREALLAAALLTFSYHHVWYSQNARGYTGLLFWTLTASIFALRGIERGSARDWSMYAVTAALGVFTHMTMIMVIGGHFLIYLLHLLLPAAQGRCGRTNGLLYGFLPAAFLVFLTHALVLPQIFEYYQHIGGGVTVWKNPMWTILEVVRGAKISLSGGLIVVLGALIVFGAGMAGYMGSRPIVIQFFAIPCLVCFVIVVGTGHSLWPRLFLFAFGFAILIVTRGAMLTGGAIAMVFKRPAEQRKVFGTALCGAVIVLSAASVPRAYGPKQDYQSALEYVQSNRHSDDVVITVGLTIIPYKYLHETGWRAVGKVEKFNEVRHNGRHSWVLYTMPVALHASPDGAKILKIIQTEYTVVERFPGTLNQGTIVVCRSK